MDKGKVEQVFHRIRKRAKLPHFRPYDLRHTFASLLLAAHALLWQRQVSQSGGFGKTNWLHGS